MIRTSGIRKKFRSNALNQFKQERTKKPSKQDDDDTDSEEEVKETHSNVKASNSLLSILPKPKNANTFGPTVNLVDLIRKPVEDQDHELIDEDDDQDAGFQVEGDNEIVEFDVRKLLTEPVPSRDITAMEDSSIKVNVPKGKEKQKNQITYLAQLSKAKEHERKEQAAQGKFNKAAARARYGWKI